MKAQEFDNDSNRSYYLLNFYLPRDVRRDCSVLRDVAPPAARFFPGDWLDTDIDFIFLSFVSFVIRLLVWGSFGLTLSCFTLLEDTFTFSTSLFSTSSFPLTEDLGLWSSCWDLSFVAREFDKSLVLLVPLSLPNSYLECRSLVSSLTILFWAAVLGFFVLCEDCFTVPCIIKYSNMNKEQTYVNTHYTGNIYS